MTSPCLTEVHTINVELSATPNTEAAIVLPDGTFELRLQCRTAVDLKVAWIAGMSGSQCFTVKSGTVYRLERFVSPPRASGSPVAKPTIYVQAGTASVVVEIECLK